MIEVIPRSRRLSEASTTDGGGGDEDGPGGGGVGEGGGGGVEPIIDMDIVEPCDGAIVA